MAKLGSVLRVSQGCNVGISSAVPFLEFGVLFLIHIVLGRTQSLAAVRLRSPFFCRLPVGDHSEPLTRLPMVHCHVVASFYAARRESLSPGCDTGGLHNNNITMGVTVLSPLPYSICQKQFTDSTSTQREGITQGCDSLEFIFKLCLLQVPVFCY